MTALPSFLPGMSLALAIGLLIGFERGWQQRDEPDGQRVAGVRTFALLALLGGLAGLEAAGPLRWVMLVAAVGATGSLLIAYALEMYRDQQVSATGAIAAFLTFNLGATASSGHHALAAIVAAIIVVLLSTRKALHDFVQRSSEEDVKAVVRLALVIFLVFPLLPDVGVGPYGSLNPQRLWLVVVTLAAISFGSYALTRALGERRGGLYGAALGGLVSSTAVTIACAQALRRGESAENQAGIAIASAIMHVRALTLVALLAPRALGLVTGLVAPAVLLSILAAVVLTWRSGARGGMVAPTAPRPPGLSMAIFFAALVGVVTVGAAWLKAEVGDVGATAAIIAGGMIDVDSAIAAIGLLPAEAVSPGLGALAIAAPMAANSLLKLGLAIGIAGWRTTWGAAIALLLPIVAIAATTTILFV